MDMCSATRRLSKTTPCRFPLRDHARPSPPATLALPSSWCSPQAVRLRRLRAPVRAALSCTRTIPTTYALMSAKLHDTTLSHPHELTLSDRTGTAEIHVDTSSDHSPTPLEIVSTCAPDNHLSVSTVTPERVCERRKITLMTLLKSTWKATKCACRKAPAIGWPRD